MFPATTPPQEVCDSFERFLTPQVWISSAELKKISKERVGCNSKIGESIITRIESILLKREWKWKETIIFLKLVHLKRVFSSYIREYRIMAYYSILPSWRCRFDSCYSLMGLMVDRKKGRYLSTIKSHYWFECESSINGVHPLST